MSKVDPLATRVAARFIRRASLTPEAKDAAYEFLKNSKLSHFVIGMGSEAKKAGQRFGMKDAKEAMELWFDGGKEPKSPAQVAARRYIESDKGKSLLDPIVKGVMGAIKKAQGRVGFKDVGEAVVAFLGE